VKYRVLILPVAQKDHNAIPSPSYEQIEQKMLALGENPRPTGCKKLKDTEGTWRIRVGVYRILYDIDDSGATVIVLRIGHRKEILPLTAHTMSGTRHEVREIEISIRLLGAFQDGYLELSYPSVVPIPLQA
jgi:mRNA interferase RelE/StbE